MSDGKVKKRAMTNTDDLEFRQKTALTSLNGMLQREYKHELGLYKVDRRIANLVCHMGFLLSDSHA